MIDYALDRSGQQNITYIGHSMGSLTVFALCSERPEFCEHKVFAVSIWECLVTAVNKSPIFVFQISRLFAVGPVRTVGHVRGGIRFLAEYTDEIEVPMYTYYVYVHVFWSLTTKTTSSGFPDPSASLQNHWTKTSANPGLPPKCNRRIRLWLGDYQSLMFQHRFLDRRPRYFPDQLGTYVW